MPNKTKVVSSVSSFSEVGICDEFVRRCGTKFRYIASRNHFVGRLGRAWDFRTATDAGQQVYNEVKKICTERSASDLSQATRLQSHRFITACCEMLKRIPALYISDFDLHNNPEQIVTISGIVCLKSGELLREAEVPPSVGFIAYEYAPDAPEPSNFLSLIHHICQGDSERITHLQALLGYCLTGYAREETLAVFYGTGGTGKGALFTALNVAFSEYAMTMSAGDLEGASATGASPDIVRIQHRRLAMVTELDEHRPLASALIKSLTGADRIKARPLFKDAVEFHVQTSLLISCNAFPKIKRFGEDWERRIRPIPCKERPEYADKKLKEKLPSERAGILNWLIKGANMYLHKGLPENPMQASGLTDICKDASAPAAWYRECVRHGSKHLVASNDEIEQSFLAYCKAEGFEGYTKKDALDLLRARGHEPKKGRSGRGYAGLELVAIDDDEEHDAGPPPLPLPIVRSASSVDIDE
jgi:putative DNA primase/helicase